MNRSHRTRARLGGLLLVALGALAMLALPGMAAAKSGDRNHDRIPDRWEKRHHLSLKVKQAHRDQDRDHLRNRAEFLAGDNPRDSDSDDDGVVDGDENAGTIKSFDAKAGRLVIDLFGGDTVSGLVTDQTEIECEDENGNAGTATASDDDGGESGEDNSGPDNQGDNSGPGSSNSGPGNDDEGEDEGDVNCTTADLVPGAIVEEAELELANGVATFEEVELAG
jgi:hypothetical protein